MSHRFLACALGAACLAGCASGPERAERSAVSLAVQSSAPQQQASLLQAELAGDELLGLFRLDSRYQVQQADRRQDTSALGQQSLSQGLQTRLPLPLGTPLQLDLSHRLEQRWTETGLLDARRQAASARWSGGGLQFALDARRSSENSTYDCGLDASLQAALPTLPRVVSGRGLQLGGQLCQRTLPGTVPQQAQILSAQTAWDDAYGQRQLRVSHALVRELPGRARGDGGQSGIEVEARHAIDLGGWSLSQQFALRPADEASQPMSWASRSEVSRRVLKVPVTASWQRSETAIWSLGAAQVPGREASLGVDLSAPLRQWLSSNAGANLSYHRLDPADPSQSADDQLRLGLSLGW